MLNEKFWYGVFRLKVRLRTCAASATRQKNGAELMTSLMNEGAEE